MGRDRKKKGGEGRSGRTKERKVRPDTTLLAFALSSFLLSIPSEPVAEKGLLE